MSFNAGVYYQIYNEYTLFLVAKNKGVTYFCVNR